MSENIKLDEPNLNPQHFDGAGRATKRVNAVVYGILLFLALVVALFLYLGFSGRDVLEVKNNPVPVRTIRPNAQVATATTSPKAVPAQNCQFVVIHDHIILSPILRPHASALPTFDAGNTLDDDSRWAKRCFKD